MGTSVIKTRDRRRFRRRLLRWASDHYPHYPWRERSDVYSVLVAEILLQRTGRRRVIPVYEEVIGRWPDAASLAGARPSAVAKILSPLGLRKRADLLIGMARALSGSSREPRSVDDFARLPGVGRYGAHAAAVFALNENLPVVDGIVGRVLRRYFGLDGPRLTARDEPLWALAEDLASEGDARSLWFGVLDFADEICRPRPLCARCPLISGCAHSELS
jgi:A/G-specific adenine glycosylase